MDSVRRLFVVALIVCLALAESAEAKDKRDEGEQDNPTDQTFKNECWLKPNYHHCTEYVPRWYYDTTYLLCKQYLYGGCDGKKANAFKSYDECMTRCAFEVSSSASSIRLEISQLLPLVSFLGRYLGLRVFGLFRKNPINTRR
uniref:Putative monolaris n=1 Tax=Rhipicephalus pulchellus TaxID=72859 RepID=L7LQP2_RHIPC